MFKRLFFGLAGLCALVLAITTVAFAPYHTPSPPSQEPSSSGATKVLNQLRTARTHANNAAISQTMGDVKWHLGHAVNCMEGPNGKNYDKNNLNPCQGQGNGILPDLTAEKNKGTRGAAQALSLVEEADKVAVEALKLAELSKVQAGAKKTTELLDQAMKALQ
ncbi:MAG: hypothetical protein QN198_06160 [Armatimonadota bacterium]|nr:hypothetical protein [Armatimonadota bacterium]MDR5703170.1 hypothetical protein [Armatimonadota bacterium]